VCLCVYICEFVFFPYVIITFFAAVTLYSVSVLVLNENAFGYVNKNSKLAIYLSLKTDFA
jgi:hypothetical protein